jgi:hypothetical protein
VSHVRITRRRVVTDDKFWLFFVLGHPPFAETGIWPFETYDDIGLGKKVVMLDLQPGIDIEEVIAPPNSQTAALALSIDLRRRSLLV